MTDELFLSGYCRAQDQSRMVTAELEDGLWSADCDFGTCPYEPACPIAKKIRDAIKQGH